MRGNAQPLTSKILTPNGFKNMGDIKIGDIVIGGSGNRTIIEGGFFLKERKMSMKLFFQMEAEKNVVESICGRQNL